MATKILTCIVCPNGCELNIEKDSSGIHVKGEMCNRGVTWAIQEETNPQRTISSNILIENGDLPLASVKTQSAVPFYKINDVMKDIKQTVVSAPISIGDILIENAGGTGVPIIATREVKVKS